MGTFFARNTPLWVGLGIAAAVIGVLGWVDYVTGPVLSLSIFYLVPVTWVTASRGRVSGVIAAGLAGVAGLVSDVLLEPHYHERGIAAWNVAFMVVSLLVVVELVHRVRATALAALAAEARGREFLSFAAHQLRTPLAGIRSTADALMLGQDNDPEQELLLAGMTRETDRAGHLVSSLLRVARIDQNERLPLRTVDLGELVGREVDRARAMSSRVQWDVAGDSAPLRLSCNPDALSEALANLLDNARRHAASRVEVTVSSRPHEVSIAVTDDGPGLSPRLADRAFERFVTLDGYGGSGLGLPIARGIAEAHGGSVSYAGGAFVISVPR